MLIKLLFLPVLMIPLLCSADTIKCYDNDKVIYSSHIENLTYTGEVFVFDEYPSGKVIMYNGNCLIKLDTD